MSLLFDSSAIIDLCGRKGVDKLLEGWTLNLAFYEIGNAMWKQVYLYKTLTLDEGSTALEALAEAVKRIRKIPVDDSLAILKIAVEEGLTYYDAAYLNAAIKNEKTLVTNDEKLYTVAKKHVKTMTSDELRGPDSA
jgi:predicted nucleic acid-binding protein